MHHHIPYKFRPKRDRPRPASRGQPLGRGPVTFERASIPTPCFISSSSSRLLSPRDSPVLGEPKSTVTVIAPPVTVTTTSTSTWISGRLGDGLPTQTVTVTRKRTSTTAVPTTIEVPTTADVPIPTDFPTPTGVPNPTTEIALITSYTTLPPATLTRTITRPTLYPPTQTEFPSSIPPSTLPPSSIPSPLPPSSPEDAPPQDPTLTIGFAVGVPLFLLSMLAAFWYLFYIRRGRETPATRYFKKQELRKKERKEGMKTYKERQRDGRGGAGGLGLGMRGGMGTGLGMNITGPVGLSHLSVEPTPRSLPGFKTAMQLPSTTREPPHAAARNGAAGPKWSPPPATQNGTAVAGPSRGRAPPAAGARNSEVAGKIRIALPEFPRQSQSQTRTYLPLAVPPLPPPPPPRRTHDGPTIPPLAHSVLPPPIPGPGPGTSTTSWDSVTTVTSADHQEEVELARMQTPPPMLPPLAFQGPWKWEVRQADAEADAEAEDTLPLPLRKGNGKGKGREWYDKL